MTCTLWGRSAWLLCSAGVVSTLLATTLAAAASTGDDDKDKKVKGPSLSLKASPSVSFSPARITVTAELRGGTDSDEDLYCPGLEWEWGDGTISEASADCEPFEAARSTIKRRFVTTHTYETAGNYRVILRFKRGSKSVMSGNTSVQVKPGVRDMSEYPQP
jgi:hypothetical protein